MIENPSVRFVLSFLVGTASLVAAQSSQRIPLDDALILVDGNEPFYVQYGAKDLGSYLTEITGKPVTVSTSVGTGRKAGAIVAVGAKMARVMGAELGSAGELDPDTSVIRSIEKAGANVVVI